VLESTTPIWVLHGNAINAPPIGFRARMRARWLRMRHHTSATRAALTFRYEHRWSRARLARVLRGNRAIEARIHQIARRVARTHGHWKRGAEAFRLQTAALRRRLVPLPFLTERHAVFLVSERGMESALVQVFPARASREALKVRDRILSFLRQYQAR